MAAVIAQHRPPHFPSLSRVPRALPFQREENRPALCRFRARAVPSLGTAPRISHSLFSARSPGQHGEIAQHSRRQTASHPSLLRFARPRRRRPRSLVPSPLPLPFPTPLPPNPNRIQCATRDASAETLPSSQAKRAIPRPVETGACGLRYPFSPYPLHLYFFPI